MSIAIDIVLLSILIVMLLLLLWVVVDLYSVRMYRFMRPNCPYCVSSKEEWDKFVDACRFKMVKTIEINMDTATSYEQSIADNMGVTTVPCYVMALESGMNVKYEGERTEAAMLKWLGYE